MCRGCRRRLIQRSLSRLRPWGVMNIEGLFLGGCRRLWGLANTEGLYLGGCRHLFYGHLLAMGKLGA